MASQYKGSNSATASPFDRGALSRGPARRQGLGHQIVTMSISVRLAPPCEGSSIRASVTPATLHRGLLHLQPSADTYVTELFASMTSI